MTVTTKRLRITKVTPQTVSCLAPLLEHQELFYQAGLVAPGGVNLQLMQVLAQNDLLLAIEDKNEGGVMGLITLLKMNDATGKQISGQLELGYLLLPDRQHHGYMTEALEKVCSILGQRGIKLLAETNVQNEASRRVLQRCHFKPIASSAKTIQRWELAVTK